MVAYLPPVDVFMHYCNKIVQISQGVFPDPTGMERIKIQDELSTIHRSLKGKINGYVMVIQLYSGELIFSSSFEDLKMLSTMFSMDFISYYGLVDDAMLDQIGTIINA